VSAAAGKSGPVLTLSGEADISNTAQLSDVITAQLASGAVYLTIDVAGLSFADSMSIGVLTGAARTLRELGGGLILLRPRSKLLKTLTLLGADRVLTILEATDIAAEPEGNAGDSA
jgi:anti-anti-sigma factor